MDLTIAIIGQTCIAIELAVRGCWSILASVKSRDNGANSSRTGPSRVVSLSVGNGLNPEPGPGPEEWSLEKHPEQLLTDPAAEPVTALPGASPFEQRPMSLFPV